MKKSVVMGVVAFSMVLCAVSFAWAAYAGPTPVPNNGPNGTRVAWTPGGFRPGETVNCYFCTQRILVGTVVADASGFAKFDVIIPTTAPIGSCTFSAEGQTSRRVVQAGFTVTQVAASSAVTTGWAYTGAQILFWLMSGAALIALGLTLTRRQPRNNQ